MFAEALVGMLRSELGTRVRGRAWSKSVVRSKAEGHDELISMGSSLLRTHMGPPHLGQCQSGALLAVFSGAGGMIGWA